MIDSVDQGAREAPGRPGGIAQSKGINHMDIRIQPGETVTIRLPGATAVRIDAEHRVIAVDTVSTNRADGEPLIPEWLVQDLRQGSYGDFHQLKPAAECFDGTCAGQGGRHATAAERADLRDYPEAPREALAAVPVDAEARRRRAAELARPLMDASYEDLKAAWHSLGPDDRRRFRKLWHADLEGSRS